MNAKMSWILQIVFILFNNHHCIHAIFPGIRPNGYNLAELPKNGPNICGYNRGLNICCEGWRKNLNSECLIPICDGNCGDRGKCIRPNVCHCHDGKERYECMTLEMYGYDYSEDDTKNIWQSDQDALASDPTINLKTQDMPDVNITENSYCFLSHEREICQDQVGPVGIARFPEELHKYADYFKMNVYECCNTVGKAWGKEKCRSCESLMAKLPHCESGLAPNTNGTCEDIDECSLGICQNGNCINRKGGYRCVCPYGMFFNGSRLSCDYRPTICEEQGQSCKPFGYCQASEDGKEYTCVCPSGYVLSSDAKSCIKRRKFLFNMCSIYKEKICQNGSCQPSGLSGFNYECFCKDGFRRSIDKKSCIPDVNMCKLQNGTACEHGDCVPLDHGYTCRCHPGYELSDDLQHCKWIR